MACSSYKADETKTEALTVAIQRLAAGVVVTELVVSTKLLYVEPG